MASCAIVTDKEDISINSCKVATSVFRFKGLPAYYNNNFISIPYYLTTLPHQSITNNPMKDPRNIYQGDVDFAALALQSPAFNK